MKETHVSHRPAPRSPWRALGAFAGLHRARPARPGRQHRPRHQRGLRRRRQRRRDLQRRLRRAAQPHRRAGSASTACTSSYRSATGAASGTPFALRGSVPAHGHYLIQMSTTGATAPRCPLPTPARPASAWPAAAGRSSCSAAAPPITTTGNMAGRRGHRRHGGLEHAPPRSRRRRRRRCHDHDPVAAPARRTDTDNNSAEFSLADADPENSFAGRRRHRRWRAPSPRSRARRRSPLAGDSRHHPGRRDRGLPDRRLLRLLHPDRGHRRRGRPGHPTPPTASSSTQPTPAPITVAARRLRRGHRHGVARSTARPRSTADAADVDDARRDRSTRSTAATTTAWPDDRRRAGGPRGRCWYAPRPATSPITDNFPTNSNGELALAQGDGPLLQPTEVARPGTPDADAVEADNAARAIVLDDGSTTLFLLAPNQDDDPLP